MAFDILLTTLLVVMNGFFVAAEFAIVKVRSSQIAVLKKSTAKKAAEVIINNLDGFLAATQLGITLASLGLGWVGEDVASKLILAAMNGLGIDVSPELAHRIALPVAFVAITIAHIVFGELAPKSLAIQKATAVTLSVSIPLRVFYFVFKPFISLLNGFANIILRMVGIKPVAEGEIHTEEELRHIIAESQEGGAIEPEERELIQNVFDFDDRIVREVMVHRTKMCRISVKRTLKEVIDVIIKEGYSRYPVYGKTQDEILGVVHAKDVITQYFTDPDLPLENIIHPVLYVTEAKKVDHLLREFQRKKIQMAMVINEYGETQGLVTLEDVLEELVGEIQDEYDQEQKIVVRTGDRRFVILARSPIHDINKYLEVPLPESEEYDTLAGLLLQAAGTEIVEGQEINAENYRFKVVKLFKTLPERVEAELIEER